MIIILHNCSVESFGKPLMEVAVKAFKISPAVCFLNLSKSTTINKLLVWGRTIGNYL